MSKATTSHRCLNCGTPLKADNEQVSAKCPNCHALINIMNAPLDYTKGGGQDVPSSEKSLQRLENSRNRFRIIESHLRSHQNFIDIGCGSGEMLTAAQDLFSRTIGFDRNEALVAHCLSKGLEVHDQFFSKETFKKLEIVGKTVFSVCHVIEHLENPSEFLRTITSCMESGDLLYVEVPLYEGISFAEERFSWSLWYEEHLQLFSMRALSLITAIDGFSTLDKGHRTFISENRPRKILKKLFRHPLWGTYRLITKKRYQNLADAILRDYGFVLIKRND